MTENEAKAVKFLENIKDHAVVTLDHIAKEEPNVSPLVYKGREEKANTILTMIEELKQYRAIGTVEDCSVAVEKQMAKKPINPDDEYGTFQCPNCNGLIFTVDRFETHKHCLLCGQKLDWSDEE